MASWTAVDWRVEESKAAEFPHRWQEMMEFAKANVGLLEWARLVQDADDPTHFVSFGLWRDRGPYAAIENPDFLRLLEGCEAICSQVTGGPGTEVVSV
jgi:quinol monooxygenase YgiN